MKIAILGTGVVGRTLAWGLARAGHGVTVGTRNPAETMARKERDAMGNETYSEWQAGHPDIQLQALDSAAAGAEIIVNCTSGTVSLAALGSIDPQHLAGKIVIDVSNPLDFSAGFPPTLSVCNSDSVAEQIQRAHPDTKVVKALNTVNARVMIDPSRAPGEHNLFMCGDDEGAKQSVLKLLTDLGWPAGRVIDLGPIRSARGMEMYLPLWLSILQKLGDPDFNIQVQRPKS